MRKILAVLLALLMTVLAGCDKTIADEENNTTEENNILKNLVSVMIGQIWSLFLEMKNLVFHFLSRSQQKGLAVRRK